MLVDPNKKPEILFPEHRLYANVFEQAYPWRTGKGRTWTVNGKTFSSYCQVDGFETFQAHNVTPKKEVMEKLAAHMIYVEDDQIYWKVVVRDDGSCGVYASYNKILGSRHVAEIQVWSVPIDGAPHAADDVS